MELPCCTVSWAGKPQAGAVAEPQPAAVMVRVPPQCRGRSKARCFNES